jgi:hypothetical protein
MDEHPAVNDQRLRLDAAGGVAGVVSPRHPQVLHVASVDLRPTRSSDHPRPGPHRPASRHSSGWWARRVPTRSRLCSLPTAQVGLQPTPTFLSLSFASYQASLPYGFSCHRSSSDQRTHPAYDRISKNHRPPFCHPEQLTRRRQVKGQMNVCCVFLSIPTHSR